MNAVAGAAGMRATPTTAELGNGGYDVQHYELSLDVDMDADTLQGSATIRARALQPLSAFYLDLEHLEVKAVSVDGAVARSTHEGREVRVEPASPVLDGAEFTVEVDYGGKPDIAADPGVPFVPGVGWWRTDSGVHVVSQCVGAATWFPCNDHPSDKATFGIRVTVSKPYVAAANGILVEEIDHGERRTFVWSAGDPMATYLATVNIADFQVQLSRAANGVPLRHYFPRDATPKEMEPFGRTGDMMERFEELFGPYPFESYGGVVSYERLGGALETQTLPVYSRGSGEVTVAHELAHQWFGNCVTPRDWKDLWLSEGFASYAEWLWREHDKGAEHLERRARQAYRYLRRAEVGSPHDPGLGELFSARVYVRGPWVLHALRRELGDEVFFRILRGWVHEHHDGTVDTEQFLAHCEAVAGRDLDAFFAEWLFSDVLPEVAEYEDEDEEEDES